MVVACVRVLSGVLSPSEGSTNNVDLLLDVEDVGVGSITESDNVDRITLLDCLLGSVLIKKRHYFNAVSYTSICSICSHCGVCSFMQRCTHEKL